MFTDASYVAMRVGRQKTRLQTIREHMVTNWVNVSQV